MSAPEMDMAAELRLFGTELAAALAAQARLTVALRRIADGPRAGLYHPEEMQDVARAALPRPGDRP